MKEGLPLFQENFAVPDELIEAPVPTLGQKTKTSHKLQI